MNTNQIKETLGVFKVLLSIFIIVAISLMTWIMQTNSAENYILTILVIATFGMILNILFKIWRRIFNLIDSLE